ncbi:MAG: DUF1826 domain-containing protein [Pseudomonadota bacterium]
MNLLREFAQEAAVAVTEMPEALNGILRPECAAIVWDRQPLARFQDWLDGLAPEQLPKTRTILRPADVQRAVTRICDLHETPDCAEREMLIGDIAAMAHIFAEVMETDYLRMRLDVITNNACRKFHIDAVTARLICTYRGTGTQYGIPTDGPDPEHISTVPTGSPILLRGTRWPTRPASGLLHRSPPIEGTGETRLMLVLDPVEDPNDDAELHLIH